MHATLDDFLDKLSRWHLIINVMAFLRGFPVTFNIMMAVFTAPRNIPYVCTNSSSEWTDGGIRFGDDTQSQCFYVPESNVSGTAPARQVSCSSWTYDRELYGRTIVEEWDVVCDQSWMLSLSQSLYLAGLMLGTIVFTHCSDWFGRRRTIVFGIISTGVAGVWAAFSTSFLMYNVARVFTAFGISAFSDIVYALVMESVSPRYRYLATISIGLGWSMGMVILPWVAYLVRDWQAMQLYISVPLGVMFIVWLFLPESPRWQMATGRYDAARDNLMRLAKCNGHPKHVVDEIIENAQKKRNQTQETKKGTFVDLFSSRKWAVLTTVFSAQLAVSSLVWYYMTVSTAGVGSNPYISFSIASATEVPVKAVNVVVIKYCRRRWAIFGTFTVITAVLIGLTLLPYGYPWVELFLLVVGKMCTSVNGAVFRVQISEAYPTVVRSVALGVCITIGRLGTVIAPFFDDLGIMTYIWAPKAVTTVLCVLCALGAALTPETFKKALEDNFRSKVETDEDTKAENGGPTMCPHEVTRF